LSALHDFLSHRQQRVEQALAGVLPGSDIPPTRLHSAMRYATLNGGKRLRACLVYATGSALGVAIERLDAPACAVELVHAYSLVHDDLPCMDNDDLRRGKPTCHKAYDEATALLAGDALQTLAFEVLAAADTPGTDATRRLAMLQALARATGSRGMAGGQAIDLASVGLALSLTQLADMHSRKTGALIQAAVALGALACDHTSPDLLRDLDRYARHAGLAFQITDDILDVEGDTHTLGKPQGSDQQRQKPTYPAIIGLGPAKRLAREEHAAALASLGSLGDNARLLTDIADYIIQRTY
jgi:farnesyl diphosphate synthase